ncbi:cupin [Streptomyces thinghirensis]|nr:cupin [Streptomyces thinghirensis]
MGLSHLSAYDWAATDGVCGGSPHLHLVCTEAYVVTGGRGAVQTLSPDGYRGHPAGARLPRLVHAGHRAPHGAGRRPAHHGADAERRPARGRGRRLHLPARGTGRPRRVRRRGHAAARHRAATECAARRRRASPLRATSSCARPSSPATPVRTGSSSGPPPTWCATRCPAGGSCGGPARWYRRTHRRPTRRALDGGPAYLADATAYEATPTRHGGYGMCGRRDEYALPGTTLPYQGSSGHGPPAAPPF